MTNKPQEVFNQSEDVPPKIFGLWLNQGSINQVAKANRNLPPMQAFQEGAASDTGELSTPGATASTLILRFDHMVPEDMLLKKFYATIIAAIITVGEASTGESVEIAITYTPPNSAVTQTLYDETVSSAIAVGAGSTVRFDFHLPPRPLQSLLAKGGIITVVITAIVTAAGGGTVQFEIFSVRRNDNELSYLAFDMVPINTSKDMELLNERLPT